MDSTGQIMATTMMRMPQASIRKTGRSWKVTVVASLVLFSWMYVDHFGDSPMLQIPNWKTIICSQ